MKKVKILIAASLLLSLTHFYSCQRDLSIESNQSDIIQKAKVWFKSYLEKENIQDGFKGLKYDWDNAATFAFDNGYKVITVPLIQAHQNVEYRGKRILYLYPWKNGRGYYTTIFELIPDRSHTRAHKGNINLKTFSGFISTWDLRKGFQRGIKYKNGVAETNIKIEIKAGSIPAAYNRTSTGGPILPGVTVYAFYPANNGFYYITLLNSLGYSTTALWSGGSGNNPCEYSGCSSNDPSDYFDEETLNQIARDLEDKQYMDEKIKDSTNNPCIASALSKLEAIYKNLPATIRDFFGESPCFNIVLKTESVSTNNGNSGQPEGGHTLYDLASNTAYIYINDYFSDATDLSIAATIIHEALHAQLNYWYNQASGDPVAQQQLAEEFGFMFTPFFINDPAAMLVINVSNPAQHQAMVDLFKNVVGTALYEFSNANASLSYCQDIAWQGCFDTKSFANLALQHPNEATTITDRIVAEKDPHGTSVNVNNETAVGTPCH